MKNGSCTSFRSARKPRAAHRSPWAARTQDEKLKPYSIITSTYTVGDVTGTVGVIGPTRMHYNKMIPLVDYVAQTITRMLSIGKQVDG